MIQKAVFKERKEPGLDPMESLRVVQVGLYGQHIVQRPCPRNERQVVFGIRLKELGFDPD